MMKVALTVAVLSLGLAACQPKAEENTANETAVENNAEVDVNAATTDDANSADAALNAADNAIDNASDAVSNAADAVDNAADNATN
jgi:hypothetical protein